MAATVTWIHTAAPRNLRGSAEAFLDTIGPGNTRRAYGIAVVKTVDTNSTPPRPRRTDQPESGPGLGFRRRDRRSPRISLGAASVNTWNPRRAAVAKWLTWCREQGWDAGTARLLPRLIRRRTRGPVFVTRPGPGKYLADRDLCPDTGQARPSYDQARSMLDAATATATDGPGWDLHELRHSGLTHLGESGASLLELMAKSRHRKAKNLRRYFNHPRGRCAN
ncbi:hypothetical protein [Rhodococcus sp. NPDC058521]|uniref:hypothetical protein n=1 Tax=Rhodococcus sp. NPDC058521 TaxID=3346536 RepID=UPI003648700C